MYIEFKHDRIMHNMNKIYKAFKTDLFDHLKEKKKRNGKRDTMILYENTLNFKTFPLCPMKWKELAIYKLKWNCLYPRLTISRSVIG